MDQGDAQRHAIPAEDVPGEPLPGDPRLDDWPRARPGGRRRRLAPAPARAAPPLTAEQRLLLLDSWRRSGLPAEASAALGLSLPRYYQVEQQALRGLTAACEPRPKGRQARPDHEASKLRRESARLRRDLLRQQTLVRAVQRSVGLLARLHFGCRRLRSRLHSKDRRATTLDPRGTTESRPGYRDVRAPVTLRPERAGCMEATLGR